jgi:hypothetical protein
MTPRHAVPSLVAVVALLGLGAVASAQQAPPTSPAAAPFLARSFTIRADAFPVEPAPGTNETSIGVRPAGTRISVSNAPAAAYGRAAATDAGTIELYTGPPPPSTVAECDAAAPNIPRHATAAPGGMQLEATCDTRPSARVVASGSGSGETRADALGDGGGVALGSESRTALPAAGDLPPPGTALPEVARPGAVRAAPRAGSDATATAPPPNQAPARSSDALALVASRRTVTLSRPWSGWWWAIVTFVLVAGAAFVQRRRLARWWDAAADRYVRG